jgi:hypothetical protein
MRPGEVGQLNAPISELMENLTKMLVRRLKRRLQMTKFLPKIKSEVSPEADLSPYCWSSENPIFRGGADGPANVSREAEHRHPKDRL